MKRQTPLQQPTPVKRRRERTTRKRPAIPRNLEQYSALAERTQDVWDNVAHVVSKMRSNGVSLYQASREYGIDPRTVIRWGGTALRKLPNGRYVAKRQDKLLRILSIPTREGLREIALRNSREATKLAKYWDAVQKYLRTGDTTALKKFRGGKITDAGSAEVNLLTRPDQLNRLGSAGVLSFESLYARSA